MKISVVIPAYNEEGKAVSVLKSLRKSNLPVYFVDDGSSDFTYSKVSKLKADQKNFNLTLLRHKINLGKGAALKTGCLAAFKDGVRAVVIMDGDGQHLASDLPKFIDVLEKKKFDIVFGSRNLNMGVPLVRFLGNKFASVFISIFFGIYVSDLLCGYRAFTKKTFEKINWISTGYGVETEMVVRVGKHQLRSCEIPVETVYYDKFKGVTILDAIGIFFDVLAWRLKL